MPSGDDLSEGDDFDVFEDACEVIDLEDVDEQQASDSDGETPLGGERPIFCCDAPIYCCTSLPSKSLVAIGTGDDRFILLDCAERGILLESKFSDSVQFAKFDHANNKYVCACDMSSQLRVWKLDSLSKPVWQIDTAEVTDISWHPMAANILFAATSQGELWMWKLPEGNSKYFSGSSGKGLVSFSILSTGHECFGAFKDGSYVKWDLRNQTTLASLPPSSEPEEDEPLCLAVNRLGTLAFVGLTNGQVVVMSLAKPFGIQRRLVCVESDRSEYRYIEAVVINNEETLLCAGTAVGTLMFYSLADYSLYSSFSMDADPSIIKVVWRKSDVIAASYDGYVIAVDPRRCGGDAPEVTKVKCFNDAVLDFDLLDGSSVVVASQSGCVRICQLYDRN